MVEPTKVESKNANSMTPEQTDTYSGGHIDMEYLSVLPDVSMMSKAGQTGYSFSEIVSEIVDNSLDAGVDEEKLIVKVNVTQEYIEIIDNAVGMDKRDLNDAMTLAKCKKEEGKLGLYGLGLKTASVAMGYYFEVISLKKGESIAYKTWWDEQEWSKRAEWKIPIQKISKVPSQINGHGTIVRIEKLRFKVGNKINQLRADIGRRFAPFLTKGLAEIWVNDEKCTAVMPNLMEDSVKKIEITTSKGKISGWVGLLKNSSQKGCYGFDTFRHGRMITYYDKIGFSQHPTVARVIGEMHMDHVPVTTNKREWNKESPEYEEAEQLIKESISQVVAESKKLSAEKRVGAVEKNKLELFKEGLAEAIYSSELKEYTRPERSAPSQDKDNNESDMAKNISAKKANCDVEKRDPSDNPDRGTVEPQNTGRKRIPKQTHIAKRNQIVVKGKTFDYTHEWSHDGIDGPLYQSCFDAQNKKLEVYTNVDFPAFQVTEDRAYYAFTQIAESIANVMVKEAKAGWEKYDEIRTILLRESMKYVAEIKD